MRIQSNIKYSKPSMLIFGTVILMIINMFISNTNNFYIELMNILILGIMGMLVRLGFNWTKYLLLIMSLLYITETYALFIISNPTKIQINNILFIIQTVVIIWSTVILFRIQKSKKSLQTV